MNLKQHLLAHLKTLLDERMAASWQAMEAAQASANEQGKSSMGDKYETSRSMGQLDRDMHARQYEQARQERLVLERIEAMPEPARYERIAIGTLVKTSAGYFFIAVSVGAVQVAGQTVLAVSAASPVGKALVGKEVGGEFLFQGKKQKVLMIE
jgi:transcription elongation GreA/GreB family factor